LHCVAWRRG